LIHQYKELQLDDTNKYLLVFPLKAKHLGEWCTTYITCYISVPEVKEGKEWICKNNKKHDTKYPLYWIFDKVSLTCINLSNAAGMDDFKSV
jgi:hypothetical protein